MSKTKKLLIKIGVWTMILALAAVAGYWLTR